MMRFLSRLTLYSFLLLSLTGCWDEQLLKDVTLIKSQAFDIDEESGKLITTVAIVTEFPNEKVPTQNVILSAEGHNTRDSRTELDKKIGNELFASKNQVTLLSEELAKEDIYSVLDVNYRSPLSSLTANLAIIEGRAEPMLHIETENVPLINDYLKGLLTTGVDTGIIPLVNLQNTLTILYDEGQDAIIPTMKIVDSKKGAALTGVGLFDGLKLSGKLDTDESTLLLILDGNKKGEHRFTRKVNDSIKNELYDDITVEVRKMDRVLTILTEPDGVKADIDVTLYLNATESPDDDLYKREVVKKLNTELSKQLTSEANTIFKKIQEANCDYLGIGRKVHAYYNDEWKKEKWKDVYPTIDLNATVTVEIIEHGIIN